jgi:hypothetical protein
MRPIGRLLGLVVGCCVAAGCSTTSPGGGSGSSGTPDAGGSGSPADAGGAADAGGGGTSSDGGGAPDAGTTADAGTGGGATDGGTAASDCDGVAPPSIGTLKTWSETFDGINGQCGLGTIAQMKTEMAAHPSWTFIDSSTGTDRATYGVWHGDLWPVPYSPGIGSDFYGYVDEGAQNFHLAGVSASNGSSHATTPSMHLYADEHVDATDPNGGMVVVGAIALPDGAYQPNRRRVMTQQPRVGPRDLPRDVPVFGVGADLEFRILVIQAGDCSGCISGQWFDGDRQPMGDGFTLLTGFAPGPSTWFETAPLIGGGLAIRRVDGPQYPYRSTWLVTVASGSTSPQPAPDWLRSRPNTNLALARGGTAYAVLPNGAAGGTCSQRLELVSPSGNACAHWDLGIAAGGCTTSELRLGMDGTILQHTPTELERNPNGRPQSCTLRYWPAALH